MKLKYSADNASPKNLTFDAQQPLLGDVRSNLAATQPKESRKLQPVRADFNDKMVEKCMSEDCGKKFSLFNRRYTCANCRMVFCGNCSSLDFMFPH